MLLTYRYGRGSRAVRNTIHRVVKILLEDASLATGVIIPNTKGDIAVGQLGLNVPIKGLGMKFPISITFANRTELVKEKVVRGNFGFTFNWDTLLSKFKPF